VEVAWVISKQTLHRAANMSLAPGPRLRQSVGGADDSHAAGERHWKHHAIRGQ